MIPIAIVLGLVLAFCFGTSDYLSKGLTGQVGFYRTTIYTLATSGALIFVPLLFLGTPILPSPYPDDALLALISVSTFVAFVFMYRGYQLGNLSIVSPTVNSFPIFSVLIVVFLLKVEISTKVLLALAGVILGIVLVSTNISVLGASRGKQKKKSLMPGISEAIMAAFFFAVVFAALGYADKTIGYLLPAMAARLGAAAVGLLAGLALKQNLSPFGGKALVRLLAMGTLEACGILAFSLTFFYSSSMIVLPIITTLGGMGAVFTVGFALIFLKEKVKPNYALGVLVLIASVGLLLYFTA
jgi:drug/metabolite transporter (DMT)-like permease